MTMDDLMTQQQLVTAWAIQPARLIEARKELGVESHRKGREGVAYTPADACRMAEWLGIPGTSEDVYGALEKKPRAEAPLVATVKRNNFPNGRILLAELEKKAVRVRVKVAASWPVGTSIPVRLVLGDLYEAVPGSVPEKVRNGFARARG
jgi:hypothetical protein